MHAGRMSRRALAATGLSSVVALTLLGCGSPAPAGFESAWCELDEFTAAELMYDKQDESERWTIDDAVEWAEYHVDNCTPDQ